MDNNTVIFGAIILSFLINLIITLVLRASDKKDRSIKNIIAKIASFRNEVKTSSDRVIATAKDCEQMVSARVEEAQSTIENVAASLDILKVHQSELNALDSVCRNYKVALDKLKAQTEQAEARIQAVQKEVRAAEEVHDFVQQFQDDTEKLANRLQDIKTEYVRLVASTEESLKKAAVKQKEDNDEMLSQFAVAIERYKSQLAEYVAGEKSGFADECERQEAIIRDGNAALCGKRDEIIAELEDEKAKLADFKNQIAGDRAELESMFDDDRQKHESDIGALKLERDQIKSDADNAVSAFTASIAAIASTKTEEISGTAEALKSTADQKRAELESRISELESALESDIDSARSRIEADVAEAGKSSDKIKEDAVQSLKGEFESFSSELAALIEKYQTELNSFADEYNKAVADISSSGDKIMTQFSLREEAIESKLGKLLDDVEREGEERLKKINADADSARENLKLSLEEDYQKVVRISKEQLDKIKNDGISIASELADEIVVHKQIVSSLNESTSSRIADAQEQLAVLKESIKSNEEKLSSVCQEITVKKQDLFKIYQDRVDAEASLEMVKGETNNLKSQRMDEESAIIRLRSLQESLKKSTAMQEAAADTEEKTAEAPAVKEEQKPEIPAEPVKKKPEDMIEAFPDDIFIGEEEPVDLSDED